MLVAQDFSIRADTSSGPLDLLTLSEHGMPNTMSSVQRRSVVMLFQSSRLSGGRDVLKQLEKNKFKAFALSASVMLL